MWAPRAWLFLKDGDVLRAVVRRKTGRTDATLPLDEKSIVTCVARTGEANQHLVLGVSHDRHHADRQTIDRRAGQREGRQTGQVSGGDERGESGSFRQWAITQGTVQRLGDFRSGTKARGR